MNFAVTNGIAFSGATLGQLNISNNRIINGGNANTFPSISVNGNIASTISGNTCGKLTVQSGTRAIISNNNVGGPLNIYAASSSVISGNIGAINSQSSSYSTFVGNVAGVGGTFIFNNGSNNIICGNTNQTAAVTIAETNSVVMGNNFNGTLSVTGTSLFDIANYANGLSGISSNTATTQTDMATTNRFFAKAAFATKVVSKVTAYTLGENDHILLSNNTAAVIYTLPSAVVVGSGREYIVKDSIGTSATNSITVISTAGNVDGIAAATGKVISTNYGSLRFVSDGTNWYTF